MSEENHASIFDAATLILSNVMGIMISTKSRCGLLKPGVIDTLNFLPQLNIRRSTIKQILTFLLTVGRCCSES